MGNCFALCKPNKKSSARAATANRRKLDFPAFGVAVSENFSHHLPPTHELKLGKMCHLLPSSTSGGIICPSKSSPSPIETEQAGGVKRIKVIITKQQLQELLTKRISVGDVLSGPELSICSSVHSLPSTCWKPQLEPIPE